MILRRLWRSRLAPAASSVFSQIETKPHSLSLVQMTRTGRFHGLLSHVCANLWLPAWLTKFRHSTNRI
jgi:DNA-binding transcriptional LysR family regulator